MSDISWVFKHDQPHGTVKYRGIVSCDYFFLQESRFHKHKARIISRPSLGNLVICSAPDVASLGEIWRVCQAYVPPVDENGRVKLDGIETSIRLHCTSSRLEDNRQERPVIHRDIHSASYTSDDALTPTHSGLYSPPSPAYIPHSFSESDLNVGSGSSIITSPSVIPVPSIVMTPDVPQLMFLPTDGVPTTSPEPSARSDTMLSPQRHGVRGRVSGTSTPRVLPNDCATPRTPTQCAVRRDDLVVLTPIQPGAGCPGLESPPRILRMPYLRNQEETTPRPPNSLAEHVFAFVLEILSEDENPNFLDFSSILFSRKLHLLWGVFLYFLFLRLCPWTLYFFLLLPPLWMCWELFSIKTRKRIIPPN